jgi:hypothetical protein
MWRSLLIIFITSLGLIGCSEKPDASDYFPLQKGLSWKYQYQLTTAVKQVQGLYSVTNLETTEIGNETVTVRRTNNGRDYYLSQKPDGIYRYASRTLFETHPVIDDPPRLVLPLPYSKDADRRWASSTTSYVIHMTGPSTISNANPNRDFVMSYQVVSRDETVIVPAGKFENCLLVEGDAKLTMFADPMTGYTDVPITTREWYAPGVGLVKLERSEPLNSSVFKGGSYVFELIGFTD